MTKADCTGPVVLIVGMPRSGTTLVSEVLGAHPEVAMLIEPHALWKAGDFDRIDDADRLPKGSDRAWIRSAMGRFAQGRTLVEKSPVNCLRPERVFACYPNARVIYLQRDHAACVHSNWLRSEEKDAFKLSLILKKYLLRSGEAHMPNARSHFPLWKQLRFRDYARFFCYAVKMFWLRQRGLLPFGPRLEGFDRYIKENGLEAYHWKVWGEAQQCKQDFASLYGDRFEAYAIEELVYSTEELKRMLKHVGLEGDEKFVATAAAKMSSERLAKAEVPKRFKERAEAEIEKEKSSEAVNNV